MDNKRFEEIVDDTINHIRETLLIKAKEYVRDNNRFHNFDIGVKRTGLTREKVLDGFLLKHEISISDMTNDLEKGIIPSLDLVNEKFGDNIIYLILKKASFISRIDDEEKSVNETDNKPKPIIIEADSTILKTYMYKYFSTFELDGEDYTIDGYGATPEEAKEDFYCRYNDAVKSIGVKQNIEFKFDDNFNK